MSMEANPERGELAITVGEQTYVLRMRLNALCALQQRTKKTYGELIGDLSMMNVESARELLWTFLQPYHGPQFKSIALVGDLMDDMGGLVAVVGVLTELFTLNRPPQKATAERGANPLTAGTGLGLSETASALDSTL